MKAKRLRLRVTVRWSKATLMWVVSEIRSLCSSYKYIAVALARQHARLLKPSQLVIFGKNGRIQTEHTYGADPRRTVG